jgi:hypothetical protein
MPTFIYDRETDRVVEVERGPRQPSRFPMIMRDTPEYLSPLGTGLISGRAQRREDLKRGNCREVDPSERVKKVPTPDWVADWRADRGIVRSNPNEDK